MNKIELNGQLMITKELSFEIIRTGLNLRGFYGNNLDALWDVLTIITEETEIVLENENCLIKNLGDYGKSIIQVFNEATEENSKLIFKTYHNGSNEN